MEELAVFLHIFRSWGCMDLLGNVSFSCIGAVFFNFRIVNEDVDKGLLYVLK